jgi:integrase
MTSRPGRPLGSGHAGQIRVLTREELERFLRQCQRQGRRMDAVFSLTWYFAMRVGEVVTIRLADLNSPARQITIRGEKNGLTRTYDCPERLWRKIELWLRERTKLEGAAENPYLFPSKLYPRAEHVSREALQASFRQIQKRAGIPGPHSIHDLRSTQATLMAREGDGIAQVAGWLRHREISSSQRYIDHAQDKAHEARMGSRANGFL